MTPVRSFFRGVGLVFRGFRLWATSPKLMLLGAVPAFLVALLYLALVVVLLIYIAPLTVVITPFANDWPEGWQVTLRIAAGIALVALVIVVLVISYTAVTLAIGDVFYERIWNNAEKTLGDAPGERDEKFWKAAARGVGNALRLVALGLAIAVLVFVVGLIPVVGHVTAVVLGAVLGGWVLALELTAFAFDARGYSLRERRRALGSQRATTVGFGVAVYVLFLIPFAAVVVMPAAVVGATMLARSALALAATHGVDQVGTTNGDGTARVAR